jgi:hypothetical protein
VLAQIAMFFNLGWFILVQFRLIIELFTFVTGVNFNPVWLSIQYFEILNSITEFFLFQILVVVTFLPPLIIFEFWLL